MSTPTTTKAARDVMIDKTFATSGGAHVYTAGEIVRDTHNATLLELAKRGKLAHFIDKAPEAPEPSAATPVKPDTKPVP